MRTENFLTIVIVLILGLGSISNAQIVVDLLPPVAVNDIGSTNENSPVDINVVPVPPPPRTIRVEDTRILNARRAGNRGRRKRTQTERPFSRPL